MSNPFPTPYPTLPGDDPKLTSSLQTAVSEALTNFPSLENPFRTAISLVAIDEKTTPIDFKHGGLSYGDSYYSASLLKMGALYAAFELMRSVNNAAAASGVTTPSALFAQLHADFDPQIQAKVPLISGAPGITPAMMLPTYEQIFATIPLTTGGLAVTFTGAFQTNLRRMIINSDNAAAAACIMALGYSWLNGTLNAGGFFFPPAQTGIWLAGTFTGAWPAVRIPSVNDGDSAQATTCFDMANLYAHIFQQTLVDADSSNTMLAMLATSAAVGDDPSFLDYSRRSGLPPRNFAVTHTKIGLGPLKTGQEVASEGTILEDLGTSRKFLTVWQNSFNDAQSLIALGFVVERAIELFLKNP
jgi:hypothetical protein